MSLRGIIHFGGLGLFALFVAACARPLGDSFALGAERTGQAMKGHERTSYVYPVQVPDSNRHVTIITETHVARPLTYKDYLHWRQTGQVGEVPRVGGEVPRADGEETETAGAPARTDDRPVRRSR